MNYDYVVVGGGSAGCTLAARLAEDTEIRVLLLESGPVDRNLFLKLPAGVYKLASGPFATRYETHPNPSTNNRGMEMAQGHVLGGGSSINGQIYTRGTPLDFDGWASEDGCADWGWKQVLPYFKRTERNESFAGASHGTTGRLPVSDPTSMLPLSRAFLQACQDLGMPYNPDFSSGNIEGCGPYQRTISRGRRQSTSHVFLRNAGPNLTVRTGCRVHSIIVERGVAVGVRYAVGNAIAEARADREVILSAGALATPKLLMLSGIGEAAHLASHGIPVVHDLPAVGRNLQEHSSLEATWELTGPQSFDRYRGLHWKLWAALEYALFKSGPAASNVIEAGGFWWSRQPAADPDIQLHLIPGSGVYKGSEGVASGNGVTLVSYPCRPHSRGSVTLRSNRIQDAPVIDLNFYSDARDMEVQIDGLQLSLEIMGQGPMAPFIKRLHSPRKPGLSRAEIADYARQNVRPGYHPVGTCKMGSGPDAVVDPQLRVHGIERLRIADCSIMPRLISNNTNATAIMIGERCADFIRGNSASAARVDVVDRRAGSHPVAVG